jgi:hypothetical protein
MISDLAALKVASDLDISDAQKCKLHQGGKVGSSVMEMRVAVLFAGKRCTNLVGGRTPRTWSAVKGPVVTETVLLSMVNLRHGEFAP